MAKRNHRSRRSQKRQSRRQRSHKQRGGAGCAALPLNTPRVQQGGMAPFNAPGMLLDHATQVQAQSADQVAAIEAATAMAKAQIGGRRRHRSHRHRSHRHRSRRQKTHRRKSSRRQRSRKQRSRRQRSLSKLRQRGGMMAFDDAFKPISTQVYGANPQFSTEFGPNDQYTGAGINQLKPAA